MRRYLLSVVLLASSGITGCGGCDDEPRRDLVDAAPPIDAPADATDAEVRPVTLTIIKNRSPVAGIRVYFLNADNSVVKTTETDLYGIASAVMVAGGSVTAIDPFPRDPDPGVREVVVGDNDLATFAGVEPGDQLVLTRNEPQRISVTIQIPTDPLASNYEISTTCGSGSVSIGGDVAVVGASGELGLQDCGATTDVVVVAIDDETSRPLSALQRAGVAVTDGGTIDLTTAAFQPLSDVTFRFSNVPQVGSLAFNHIVVSTLGPFGVPFSGFVSLTDGAGMLALREPTIDGTSSVITANLFTGSRQHIVSWFAASSTYTLDMAGLLLPTIGFPSYDAATRKLTWDEADTGATPDLTIAGINVSATSERTWRWVIAAPYRRGEVTFPSLPTDVASWAPGPDDSVSADRQINAKVTGGYDAVRGLALDLRGTFLEDGDLIGFVSGPTGRAVVAQPDSIEVGRPR
jgi:hypothetical protein